MKKISFIGSHYLLMFVKAVTSLPNDKTELSNFDKSSSESDFSSYKCPVEPYKMSLFPSNTLFLRGKLTRSSTYTFFPPHFVKKVFLAVAILLID